MDACQQIRIEQVRSRRLLRRFRVREGRQDLLAARPYARLLEP
jgi:hypothetical protein